MITRIVKMTFMENRTEAFLEIFSSSKEKIRAFKGCLSLELLQDVQDPRIFMTHSTWESEAALEAYRQSALFKTTWAKTKTLFADKAEAHSLQKLNFFTA
jgi:quinol monooxygenase YgiN